MVSAVKRVKFVSARMLYIVLRGCWCSIIVLKAHAPTEKKSDDSDSFYCELKQVMIFFLSTIWKFCYEILMQN